MKRIAIFLLNALIKLLSSKAILLFFKKLIYVRNYVYSGIISNSLKSKNFNSFFEFPIIIKGSKFIEIGQNFNSRSRLRIEAYDYYESMAFQPVIKIGHNVEINFDCHIGAINRIEIGDNVLIGSRVLITDHNHGRANLNSFTLPPSKRALFSKGPVIIEDNVWIGEGVCILANVNIGKNSIIGANSVVTKDIPMNCIASGVPAVITKKINT